MKPAVAIFLGAVLGACGPSSQEFDETKSKLSSAQSDLERTRAESARLGKDLAATTQARDEASKRAADQEAKAAALEKDLSAARQALAAKESALAAAEKEKAKAAEEVARAKQASGESEKRLASFGDRQRQLEAALREKEDALAKARAEAEEAAARLREREAAPPPAAEAKPAPRLAYEGTEEIPAYQILPLTFQAKKGQVLRWVWSIVEGPPDLAADALDFSISGPDRAKTRGALVGKERTGDEGTLEVPVEGRWTIVWSNRHPTGKFKVRFEASIQSGS